MVESLMQPQERYDRNPQADLSNKQFVLTIGDCGHGKSTFNNALIGAHKNEASDGASGVTQKFQMHSSILPEFQDTVLIDSPGLNDPDMALENWVAKYNNTIGQQNAPRLSLVVLLIQSQTRPSPSACLDLATLLSCVTELRARNFIVVYNKCLPNYTVARAIEFFQKAVQTLEESAQKSINALTEQQVLLIKNVNQDEVNQELVEKSIRPQVVKFISEKLKEITRGSVIQQRQTTYNQIIEKTGEIYREKLVKLNEKVAQQEKSIDDLKKAILEGESLRQKAEKRHKEERDEVEQRRLIEKQEFELRFAEEMKKQAKQSQEQIDQQARQIGLLSSTLSSIEVKMSQLLQNKDQPKSVQVKDHKFTLQLFEVSKIGTYTGDWKDDKPNGKGTFRSEDGRVFEGEFKDGQPNGKGTLRSEDGGVFEGEFKDGQLNGKGTVRFANGNEVEAEFKDGQPNGKGTCRFANGNIMDLELKDEQNEIGTFKWANGDVYQGELYEGKMHGKGTFIPAHDQPYKGIWENGILQIKL